MEPIVTIKVADQNSMHTRIKVWNRGGLAGTLVVLTEDAPEIIRRLNDDKDPAVIASDFIQSWYPGRQ